jgi:hypothetical protein
VREVEKIKIGFSLYGLFIVALQSLPNIVWALWPPVPDSLEGNASSVPFIEYGEHILGVMVVVLLLFLMNKTQTHRIPHGGWMVASFISIALYWLCWVLYFAGIQPTPMIYAMVILPPVAFFCAGAAEKIWPIPAVSAVFLVFHLLVALENFPLGL